MSSVRPTRKGRERRRKGEKEKASTEKDRYKKRDRDKRETKTAMDMEMEMGSETERGRRRAISGNKACRYSERESEEKSGNQVPTRRERNKKRETGIPDSAIGPDNFRGLAIAADLRLGRVVIVFERVAHFVFLPPSLHEVVEGVCLAVGGIGDLDLAAL